ncbi:MAG: hypothetical protein JKX76_02775, partial [Colwellia sp.]|nr:hypothetical protein [Colwellia sp.]
MEIPADLLRLLALDSKFFGTLLGCRDVTDTDTDTGGLDTDVSESPPDNSAAIMQLSSHEQLAALFYYFKNHVPAVQRCCALYKLGLPCVDEVAAMFHEKLSAAGCDLSHFMDRFPVDGAGRLVDSPWGPWFAQWCGENECRTIDVLLPRLKFTIPEFDPETVSRALLCGDFVA